MTSTTFGLRTFTTTSVPSTSVAKCACPMDAQASGSAWKLATASDVPVCSSEATISWTTSVGIAGAASCSLASAVRYSGASRSALVERSWPSLMNVGPASPPQILRWCVLLARFAPTQRALARDQALESDGVCKVVKAVPGKDLGDLALP